MSAISQDLYAAAEPMAATGQVGWRDHIGMLRRRRGLIVRGIRGVVLDRWLP